jgi:hypothetical protein
MADDERPRRGARAVGRVEQCEALAAAQPLVAVRDVPIDAERGDIELERLGVSLP